MSKASRSSRSRERRHERPAPRAADGRDDEAARTADEADAVEHPAAEAGAAEDIERRNQALQDKSLGAPVTGMPGTPKPARR